MGKVVNMADWRNRIPKPVTDRDVVIQEIKRLLQKSIESNSMVARGRTVEAREKAAIDGLEYLMQAHRYAESKGFKLEKRTEDANGNVHYQITW